MNNFSFFKAPVRNTIPETPINLSELHELIISDKYKNVTDLVRNAKDKASQNTIKSSKLDYVTLSGLFDKRHSKGLISHSGLICVDIDDLNNITAVKDLITRKLEPALLFNSPGGRGLKVVYKIDIDVADHLEYFNALKRFYEKEMGIKIDDACKDVARACYIAHDSDAVFNPDAEILDGFFTDTYLYEPEKIERNSEIKDYDLISNNLIKWLNKKKEFVKGNRNKYVAHLTAAYNRFGIPKDYAIESLLSFEQSDFTEYEIRSIVKSTYRNKDYHNTERFDMNSPFDDFETVIDEMPLLPIDGFPEKLQMFIQEYVDTYNIPRDYIAASVLFASAFAIGTKMELKGKYDNIPLLWMCIVGNVSSGKTEPLKTAMSYFIDRDKEAYREYKINLSLFNDFDSLTKKEKSLQDETVPKPEFFQYLINDYTPESLHNAHIINERGICVYRDELKGWLDDFGRYSKSGEQSTMLSSFYRQPMLINRASKEPIMIAKPAIYLCGGIQPEILKDLAKDSRAENGFLSRMAFVYPNLDDKRPYSTNKLSENTLLQFNKFLSKLNSIDEVKLTLSKEAEKLYEGWYNTNVKRSNAESSGYLKGVYGKLDVMALRFAIVIHGMTFSTSTEINADSMKAGLEITEYFKVTALKVYNKIFGNTKSTTMTKKDVILFLSKEGVPQIEIAKILNVRKQYVNKILKIT
mgnify:CR=1 FL=1